MNLPNRPDFVVIDASVLVAFCGREPRRYDLVKAAMDQYLSDGSEFYAPRVIISETLYVLCRKLADGTITAVEHSQAVLSMQARMPIILPPPRGDTALIGRAEQIRSGYSCRRSADSLYLALAEDLALMGSVEILTFDANMPNHAASNAHRVNVRLL